MRNIEPGIALIGEQKYSEAIEHFVKAFERTPDDYRLIFFRAYSLRQKKEFELAKKYFELLLDLGSIEEKLKILGKYYWSLIMIDLADNAIKPKSYFTQALEGIEELLLKTLPDRFKSDCLAKKVMLLKELGEHKKAIECAESFPGGALEGARAAFSYGKEFKKLDRVSEISYYKKGLDFCIKGLKIKPNNINLYYYLTDGYVLLQNWLAVVENVHRIKLFYNSNRQQINESELQRIKDFNSLIYSNEEDMLAFGQNLIQKSPAEAFIYFEKILSFLKNKFDFLIGKANSLHKLKRYEEAISIYRDILDMIELGIDNEYKDINYHDYYRKEIESGIIQNLISLADEEKQKKYAEKIGAETKLQASVRTNNFKETRRLLDYGVDINAAGKCLRDNDCSSPPVVISLSKGFFSISLLLIIKGANLSLSGNDGCNALHAILGMHDSTLELERKKLLLRFVVAKLTREHVNALTKARQSAIVMAIQNGHDDEILQSLINSGADIDQISDREIKPSGPAEAPMIFPALHTAVISQSKTLPYILRKAQINIQEPKTGFTALHLAVIHRIPGVVGDLLRDHQADPNILDRYKKTPLHHAFLEQKIPLQIPFLLYKYGANLELINDLRHSKLDFMIRSNKVINGLIAKLNTVEEKESDTFFLETGLEGSQSLLLRFKFKNDGLEEENYLLKIPNWQAVLDMNYPLTDELVQLQQEISLLTAGDDRFLPSLLISHQQMEILSKSFKSLKEGSLLWKILKKQDDLIEANLEGSELDPEKFKILIRHGIFIQAELENSLTLSYDEKDIEKSWRYENGKSIPSIINVFLGIAEALSILHNGGFVHRDLNPRNVLLQLDKEKMKIEKIKLIDFGKAQRLDSENRVEPKFTSNGMQSDYLYEHIRKKTKPLGISEDYYQFVVLLLAVIMEFSGSQIRSWDTHEMWRTSPLTELREFIKYILYATESERENIDLVASFTSLAATVPIFKIIYKKYSGLIWKNVRIQEGKFCFEFQDSSQSEKFFDEIKLSLDGCVHKGETVILPENSQETISAILNCINKFRNNSWNFQLLSPIKNYLLERSIQRNTDILDRTSKLKKLVSAFNLFSVFLRSPTDVHKDQILKELPDDKEIILERRSNLCKAFLETLQNFSSKPKFFQRAVSTTSQTKVDPPRNCRIRMTFEDHFPVFTMQEILIRKKSGSYEIKFVDKNSGKLVRRVLSHSLKMHFSQSDSKNVLAILPESKQLSIVGLTEKMRVLTARRELLHKLQSQEPHGSIEKEINRLHQLIGKSKQEPPEVTLTGLGSISAAAEVGQPSAIPPSIPSAELIYEEIAMPKDGHCFYNAVGVYVGCQPFVLRGMVADELRDHPSEYKEFITLGRRTLEEYIDRVRNTTEWAGDVEIKALMRRLQRPIIIIRPGQNPETGMQNRTFEEKQYHNTYCTKGGPIYIKFDGINHYNAIILREDTSCSSQLESKLTNKENLISLLDKISQEGVIDQASIQKEVFRFVALCGGVTDLNDIVNEIVEEATLKRHRPRLYVERNGLDLEEVREEDDSSQEDAFELSIADVMHFLTPLERPMSRASSHYSFFPEDKSSVALGFGSSLKLGGS